MRKRLALAPVAAALALIGGGAITSAANSIFPPETLKVTLGASALPKELPRHRYAPVKFDVFGAIRTTDGTHPSALREVAVNIDKDLKIDVESYPVCKAGQIETRNTATAEKACGDAILGKGKASAEIAFPEQSPVKIASPLLVFNGGERDGQLTLLIHTFITVPVPAAIVTRVKITRSGSGLKSIARIPVIARGNGSTLGFSFRLGKTYVHTAKKLSYLEAKCPDGVFKVSVPKVLFKSEAREPGVAAQTVLKGSLAVPCTPKG